MFYSVGSWDYKCENIPPYCGNLFLNFMKAKMTGEKKSMKRGRALKEHIQLKEDVQPCQDCSLDNICSYLPTTMIDATVSGSVGVLGDISNIVNPSNVQDKATHIAIVKVVSTTSENCVIPPSFDLKLGNAVSDFFDLTLVVPPVSASVHYEPVQVHSTSMSEAFVTPLVNSPNVDSNTNVTIDPDTSVDLEASVNLEKLSKGFFVKLMSKSYGS
ncbi:hypothetical protein O6H91_09G113000 [Diphasiastrum complanatum]|uniref:Uncharacterized protein n=1 Tax=Diphasiastrum complanatum TaxID=34168 RepID=A0ACC2CTG3_DIPCM|nr:hypothetical protein O6H91_09G113000 [Diphasiastrum complanatum]